MSRSWTADQKRQVAAAQKWTCGHCANLLNAAFEIDHIVPLENGGEDDILTNAQALCSNCHSLKTQRERVDRIARARKRLAELQKNDVCTIPVSSTRAEDAVLDETNPFAKFCFLPQGVTFKK